MKKLVYLLIFVVSFAYGCALCNMDKPVVNTSFVVYIDEQDKLSKIEFDWELHPTFTKTLINRYDTNHNGKLDKKEIEEIGNVLIEYMADNQYLTSLVSNNNNISFSFGDFTTILKNDSLFFSYVLTTDKKLVKNDVFSILLEDKNRYFTFVIVEDNIKILNKSSLDINFLTSSNKVVVSTLKEDDLLYLLEDKDISSTQETKQSLLENTNSFISQKLSFYIQDIKDGKSYIVVIFLLVFSFLYGFIHALGPGHGKMVVASYIFGTNKNYQKAMNMAFLIGLVHAFSAFVLTLIILFVLKTFLLTLVDDSAYYITKVAGVVIVLIAFYLIKQKFWQKEKKTFAMTFSTHQPSCKCGSCQIDDKKSDLGVILSAGLIPCPGTVMIFILALSNQLYFIGILSALFMSFGMSLVIFLSAILSIELKNKSSHNPKILRIFELIALLIMSAFGTIMVVL